MQETMDHTNQLDSLLSFDPLGIAPEQGVFTFDPDLVEFGVDTDSGREIDVEADEPDRELQFHWQGRQRVRHSLSLCHQRGSLLSLLFWV